jgi:glycerol-1-phosphate dehydrogenase [NAD(P)+]
VYLAVAFRYSGRVKAFFFRDFLARFDGQGNLACDCGTTHHIDTRSVLVAPGALADSADLLAANYGSGVRLWVLSDENTEAAAGERWKSGVRAARVWSRVLPGQPRPVPAAELVEELAAEVRTVAPHLLVAVGSGVISDLVKSISLASDIPNWCVATAASVDAYSSSTSALDINDFHTSLPARISQAIICDLDVIAGAPREMFLAGLGDLLAKYLAYLDWNLARIVTGEHYCPLISSTALESARSALSAARKLREDPAEAVRTLTDAALSSGFAMQAMRTSRSAASVEHTMAHFWETANAVRNERLDLHGILAGAASRIVMYAYRALYARLDGFEPDVAGRLRAYDQEPPWQETVEAGLLPFIEKVREVMAGRRFDRDMLAQRLRSFDAGRAEILRLAGSVLDELAVGVRTLEDMGYPFSPNELGIGEDHVQLPLRNARLLRQRYTGCDLAYELGLEKVLHEAGEDYVKATK